MSDEKLSAEYRHTPPPEQWRWSDQLMAENASLREQIDALRLDAACWRREAEAVRAAEANGQIVDERHFWSVNMKCADRDAVVIARAATDQRFPDGVPGAAR